MLVVMDPLPFTQSSHIFILKRKTSSSAFNSISSMKQITLDFLTNRPQTVQIGNQTSYTLVLNTGAPITAVCSGPSCSCCIPITALPDIGRTLLSNMWPTRPECLCIILAAFVALSHSHCCVQVILNAILLSTANVYLVNS